VSSHCAVAATDASSHGFPGLGGAVYRTLVIRSGGHRLIVRRLLRQVATAARTTVATGPAAREAERLR